MSAAFTHRTLVGWISEFVNRSLPGAWPQIPLDDETLADLAAYFDLCRESGYNEVVVWGFFVDRRWPLDIASCIDADRRERIQRVVEAAHARGLRIHSGLGVYSWGFDAIIEARPHLSRDNPRVMCPAVPEAREWMERVIDFVMDGFGFDGLNMQSADNGRCTCDDCKGLSTVAYHARLNTEVARYIHARWPAGECVGAPKGPTLGGGTRGAPPSVGPGGGRLAGDRRPPRPGRCLIMDNWGCPFSDPADLPHLAAMSREMGYVIDHNNSAMQGGRPYRRRLIAELACPFGTLAGRSVWPPQRWPRDKWFLPTTLVNVDYVRELHADGARAVEQFVTTLANPSGEVTLRFMGRLLADVYADPDRLLRDAVAATYEPRDTATLDGLVEVVRGAERAYFAYSGRDFPPAGLFYVDGGLMPREDPSPETYLRVMSLEGRAAYADAIARIAREFERLRQGVGQTAKAERTTRCLQSVLDDARRTEVETKVVPRVDPRSDARARPQAEGERMASEKGALP